MCEVLISIMTDKSLRNHLSTHCSHMEITVIHKRGFVKKKQSFMYFIKENQLQVQTNAINKKKRKLKCSKMQDNNPERRQAGGECLSLYWIEENCLVERSLGPQNTENGQGQKSPLRLEPNHPRQCQGHHRPVSPSVPNATSTGLLNPSGDGAHPHPCPGQLCQGWAA